MIIITICSLYFNLIKRTPCRFIYQAIRIRETVCICLSHPPASPPPSSPARAFSLAALHCPPSHPTIAINLFLRPHIILTLSLPPLPIYFLPLLHRSHITSFRHLTPNTRTITVARIGAISAQRAARTHVMPILTRIRNTVLPSGPTPAQIRPVGHRVGGINLYSFVSRRIRYYQDNAPTGPRTLPYPPRARGISTLRVPRV